MMKLIRFFSLLGLLLLAGCSFTLAGDITPPPDYQPPPAAPTRPEGSLEAVYPLVAPAPDQGAPIYAEKCAPCHGDEGRGDGPRAIQLNNPVPAIGSPEVARPSRPADWFVVVRDGRMDRFMPGFASLSDRQRWDVLAYVYTLSAQQDGLERGEELYGQNCAGCHGETGRGDGPQAGGAAMIDFTDQAAMVQKSAEDLYNAITAGVEPGMPAFAGQLSDQERWSLAAYLRTLTFAMPGGVRAASPDRTPLPEATPTLTATGEITATGVIRGKVINGSGGEVPAGLEVTMHGFDAMQLVISDTTRVQPGGGFEFEGVAMPPGRTFLATTKYGQATYGSAASTVQEGQELAPLDITIYDSTTEPDALTVDRMHIILDFSASGTVQVVEFYIISNSGDKTLVAAQEGGAVLEFKLPEGATNLQFQDGALGDRYLPVENGFADTTPVMPSVGQYQVLYAFEMPFDRRLEVNQPLNLPVSDVVVLFPDEGVKLKSDQLQDQGTQDVEGAVYRIYGGSKLEAGSTLRFTLSGRPGGADLLGSLGGDRGNIAIGLGALGVVFVVVGLLVYRRSRARDDEAGEDEGNLAPEEAGEETADDLIDAILALDDLYQEGNLPADAYQNRRAELKARLRSLVESEDAR